MQSKRRIILNYEQERRWKETVVTRFKVVTWNACRHLKKLIERLVSVAGFRSKVEDDIARRRSKKANKIWLLSVVVCKHIKHVTQQNQPIQGQYSLLMGLLYINFECLPTQRFYRLALPSFSILLPLRPSAHFEATHTSAVIVAKSAKTAAGCRHGFKFESNISRRNKQTCVTHSVS